MQQSLPIEFLIALPSPTLQRRTAVLAVPAHPTASLATVQLAATRLAQPTTISLWPHREDFIAMRTSYFNVRQLGLGGELSRLLVSPLGNAIKAALAFAQFLATRAEHGLVSPNRNTGIAFPYVVAAIGHKLTATNTQWWVLAFSHEGALMLNTSFPRQYSLSTFHT